MNTHAEKNPENQSRAIANSVSEKESGSNTIFQYMVSNSPRMVVQRQQMQSIFGGTTQTESNVVQRIDGSALTLAMIGENAKSYGIASWDDGEFITYDLNDTTRYEVHVHFYGVASENVDAVSITGHAIWKKRFGTDLRNQQTLTITASRNGGRWNADLTLGDEQVDLKDYVNTDSKKTLYEDVVKQLASLIQDILNEDI